MNLRTNAIATLLSAMLISLSGAQEPVIRVALKPFIESSNAVVRVGEVAKVTASDRRLKDAIDQLDIADAPHKGGSKLISREQIELRLALAGVKESEASVTGANTVRIVYRPEAMRDETVLSALREPLAELFNVPTEDLELQLAQPLPRALAELEDTRTIRLAPRLPDTLAPGRHSLQVAVYENNQMKLVAPVAIETKIRRLIPRVTKAIKVGEAFTPQNVEWEKLPVSGAMYETLARDLTNRTARRDLPVGVHIRNYDITSIGLRNDQSEILVRSRDLVRLTARKGDLKVVLSAAQALQQGRLNDTIRLRNTDTGKILTGKIVGPGQVETEL